MAVYVLADITVTDPQEFQVYAQQSGATIEKYGGRYVARDGQPEALEGNWEINRIVLLEFATVEQVRAWYDSPEYSAIKGIRQHASNSRLLLVHGLSSS